MSIIGIIFIGLIVGLIARFLKPGNDSMGWIMTILLGVGRFNRRHLWRRRRWVFIKSASRPGLLVRWSVRWCC